MSSLPRGKLLIVDDEPSIRRALHQTLQAMGFGVGEAASGEEAIALARTVRDESSARGASRFISRGRSTTCCTI